MSNQETESFQGTKSDQECPNCGSPLYSGLAEGGILVCRDEEGFGCQLAVDPAQPEGLTMASAVEGPWDAEAAPEVGPGDYPTSVPAPAPEDTSTADVVSEPWVPPISAPQAQNFTPPEGGTDAGTQSASTEPVPAGEPRPLEPTSDGTDEVKPVEQV